MTIDSRQVRAHFPALQRPTDENGTLPVFFDNPAGTQVPQAVIDAFNTYYTTMNANSGGTFATSQRNDAMASRVRELAAAFLNAPRADEIAFGPNMTTLNFRLSRALARTLQPGDEVVVTRMDHDANVSPWLIIAADEGLTVRYVDIRPEDATLDMDSLRAAINPKTRIVATVHASNAAGTINPVQQIAALAHEVGAYFVVDAVQSAPHIALDVQAIGCDFLLCSGYKFFGPHIGVLWGKHDLMASLPVDKVRPAKDVPPHRWEVGTNSYEAIAATGAALEYLLWVGREFGAEHASEFAHLDGERLGFKAAMTAISHYERSLVAHLLAVLARVPGVKVYGITDPERYDERVPTVIFTMDDHTPQDIAAQLAQHDIYVWDGHYYAVEIMERLGHGEHGMVRVGLAHYNTQEEINRLETALRSL